MITKFTTFSVKKFPLSVWSVLQQCRDVVRVNEIDERSLAKEEISRCGNSVQRNQRLERQGIITIEEYEARETTRRIIKAAISFVEDAEQDGANMRNAAFILFTSFRSFAIIAGEGDWEYTFKEDDDGDIYGRCVRLPLALYLYDKAKNTVSRLFRWALGFIPIVGPQLSQALEAP